jgi:hypothetical protein
MARMTTTRRRFLQALGLGAGGALLPSAIRRGASARASGPAAPPMRLVILFTEHGVPHVNWDMHRGRPADAEWEYDLAGLSEAELSPCLRPLHRHLRKLTVVDGLSLATAIGDPYGDGHAKGWCSALTGGIARATVEEIKSLANHPSLDQVVARAARASDPTLTDLVSLEFGAYQWNFHAALWGIPSSGGPVVRVPHEESPRAAFNRLFPNGNGSEPPDPVKAAQADVMAEVGDLYAELAPRLSGEDRQKLEQHRDMVRDVENRIRLLDGLDCGAPGDVVEYGWNQVPHGERYLAHTRSFWDLATIAVSCGISRVVTMQWGQLPVELIGGTGDLHHDYAHRSAPYLVNEPDYPNAVDKMTNYSAVYAGLAAELCDRLDAIPDVNGTLLDNTIVLWVSELSDGGHGHDPLPVVILGGGNRFRTGRYLHYARDTLTTTTAHWVSDDERIGLPHNHLLVSVAQAMGVPTSVVGDASIRPKKASAPAIDLSGPLPRLV